MSDLIPGCTAMVVRSLCPENVGKIVTVGNFIDGTSEFPDWICYEVNQPMVCLDGTDRYLCTGKNLQRFDDHKEKEHTKISQTINTAL